MAKCRTEGCDTQVSPHQWNGYDLWCKACHIKARFPNGSPSYEQQMATKIRNFQKRVFADGRAGRIE
jgi:hypothetical protein